MWATSLKYGRTFLFTNQSVREVVLDIELLEIEFWLGLSIGQVIVNYLMV